ncbi:MAG: hypothetical protein ABI658_24830 [Acidimicrobiales bacterium]
MLDNCEHVIDAAGSLVDAIVHACPRVVVLATSREALGVDGELLRPLGSLGVPAENVSFAELAAAASVQLFTERAQAVRPTFALDADNGRIVADICRRLDGVPLAIELAAARVAVLNVLEIAHRLDQRFRLLTGGRRTALERHQTLRAAIDWSYELLESTEATLFTRLAVFAGSFTLDDVEAVASGGTIVADAVLDPLSSLVSRSMVVADEAEDFTRYRLLETMRVYARERLDNASEGESVRRRHAEHYVALAQQADQGLHGRDEEAWVRRMDAEFANFPAALDWCVATGDVDLALAMTIALSRFGIPRIRYGVYRLLDMALAMPEARRHRLRPQAIAHATASTLVLSFGTAQMAAPACHGRSIRRGRHRPHIGCPVRTRNRCRADRGRRRRNATGR